MSEIAMLRGVLVSFLAACAAANFAQGTLDGYVRLKPGESLEKIASTLPSGGKVIGRVPGAQLVRIRIPENSRAQTARKLSIEHWEASPGGPEDRGSFETFLGQLKDARDQRRALGKAAASGWMEAKKERMRLRTYPYDRIDHQAAVRAMNQASQMPSFEANDAGTRMISNWEYVGAKNLTPPKQLLYYGNKQMSGRVNALAYDPQVPGVVYAGAAAGGLWKSVNSGSTWTFISKDFPSQEINVIRPVDSSTIYVGLGDLPGGLGYGYGLLRTTNGGLTWSRVGNGVLPNVPVNDVAVVPNTNGQTILVAMGDPAVAEDRIWRTTNGGANWSPVSGLGIWSQLSVGSANQLGGRYIWAACAGGGSTSALYRSSDFGATWSSIPITGVTADKRFGASVAASKLDWNTVYLMVPQQRQILRTRNAGGSWTNIGATVPNNSADQFWSQGGYNDHILTSKAYLPSTSFPFQPVWQDVLYAGVLDLAFYSDPLGWTSVGGPVWTIFATTHADQHSMAEDPHNPNSFLVGNDGGVYKFYNSYKSGMFGTTMTPVNSTLQIQMYYHFDVAQFDGVNRIMAGSQDNGIQASSGTMANWQTNKGGDGAYVQYSRKTRNLVFSSIQSLDACYSYDGGVNWTQIPVPMASGETAPFIGRTELDWFQEKYWYAGGTKNLYQFDIATAKWKALLGEVNSTKDHFISALRHDTASDTLFVGTSTGHLRQYTSAGGSFRVIDGNLPDRSITSIALIPTQPKALLVTLGGWNAGQLYYTADRTITNPVWSHRQGFGITALPNIPANDVWVNPSAPATNWWVANDIGVYVTNNGGGSWMNATDRLGLPRVEVTRLVENKDGFLYASTFGRGMFRFRLNQQQLSLTFNPTYGVVKGMPVNARVGLSQTYPSSVTMNMEIVGPNLGIVIPSILTVPAGVPSVTFPISMLPATGAGPLTIRIHEPTGATTTATLPINWPSVASLTLNPTQVLGGKAATVTATLDAPAIAGRTAFYVGENSSYADVLGPFNFAVGATTATATVNTTSVPIDSVATITSGTQSASLKIMRPRLKNLLLSTNTVVGGSSTPIQGRIEMDETSTLPITITMSYGGFSYLTGPATVTIPANSRFSSWFNLSHAAIILDVSLPVTARQINSSGVQEAIDTETVNIKSNGVKEVKLNSDTIIGGYGGQGTVTLASPAPTGGASVTLSEASAAVTVPTTITIPAGQTTGTFLISTTKVSMDQVVEITATYKTSKSAQLRVKFNGIISVVASPTSIKSGQTSTVTVTLGQITSTALTCTISALVNGPLTIPATVTIPAGSRTGTFTVTGKTVATPTPGTVTVSALATSGQATITVNKP